MDSPNPIFCWYQNNKIKLKGQNAPMMLTNHVGSFEET